MPSLTSVLKRARNKSVDINLLPSIDITNIQWLVENIHGKTFCTLPIQKVTSDFNDPQTRNSNKIDCIFYLN